jgi:hypothetical protein
MPSRPRPWLGLLAPVAQQKFVSPHPEQIYLSSVSSIKNVKHEEELADLTPKRSVVSLKRSNAPLSRCASRRKRRALSILPFWDVPAVVALISVLLLSSFDSG